MKLLLPAYIYPSDDPASQEAKDWEFILANAARIWGVIINIGSGPGPTDSRDTNYVRLVDRLRNSGVAIFGYTSSDYGRSFPVQRCIDHVKQWEDQWGIVNAFIDECSSTEDKIPFYATLEAWIKGTVILNPGVIPDRKYLKCGDIICSAETDWATYRAKKFPDWVWQMRHRFYHIILGMPPDRTTEAVNFAINTAEYIYVTDQVEPKAFTQLPKFLPRIFASLKNFS